MATNRIMQGELDDYQKVMGKYVKGVKVFNTNLDSAKAGKVFALPVEGQEGYYSLTKAENGQLYVDNNVKSASNRLGDEYYRDETVAAASPELPAGIPSGISGNSTGSIAANERDGKITLSKYSNATAFKSNVGDESGEAPLVERVYQGDPRFAAAFASGSDGVTTYTDEGTGKAYIEIPFSAPSTSVTFDVLRAPEEPKDKEPSFTQSQWREFKNPTPGYATQAAQQGRAVLDKFSGRQNWTPPGLGEKGVLQRALEGNMKP